MKLEELAPQLREQILFNFQGCQPKGEMRFGFGVSELVGEIAAKFTDGRVLIITGRNLTRMGVADRIAGHLKAIGLESDIFCEVDPEPHIDTMIRTAEQLKKHDYKLIVGLGGGSVLDTAKLAALFATSEYDPMTLMKNEQLCTPGLPTILLPTTAGTGSEVSPFVVISDEGNKFFVDHPCVYGTVALVDPMLTTTMPASVTAFTGLDALSHGVEGVCGKGMDNPYSLALSTQCVELMFKYLKRAVDDPEDLEARYYVSFASVLGMMAYIQGGGLYAHSMSYVLTKFYDKPHGFGCGITMPYTLVYNRDHIGDILRRYGLAIYGRPAEPKEVTDAFAKLTEDVGIKLSLKENGVTEDMIPTLAKELVVDNYRRLNPRDMNLEESNKFVKAMFEGNLEGAAVR